MQVGTSEDLTSDPRFAMGDSDPRFAMGDSIQHDEPLAFKLKTILPFSFRLPGGIPGSTLVTSEPGHGYSDMEHNQVVIAPKTPEESAARAQVRNRKRQLSKLRSDYGGNASAGIFGEGLQRAPHARTFFGQCKYEICVYVEVESSDGTGEMMTPQPQPDGALMESKPRTDTIGNSGVSMLDSFRRHIPIPFAS